MRCPFLVFLFALICYLPAHLQNLPPLGVTITDSAATQGYYFLSPYTNGMVYNYDRSHQILDRYGRLVFYQIVDGQNLNPTIDFKLQPDGRISYFSTDKSRWYFMDSTLTLVDSIQCLNFVSNQHDIKVLPNHHYLMFADETRIMNLTSYHYFGFSHTQPGSANAQVIGAVIQEFDENKVLVWEWKSHDHYSFGDVDPVWLFSPNKVDWTHANSVEMDYDGNVLLSLRHFNEITKIDHATGNIIWRLGGKKNQFTFPNDPIGFTGQHDIRRIGDSALTIFDNGQYTHPAMSRGLMYVLDESSKIATLTWEYIYDSSMYSIACGNHQYFTNGNHLIDFGFWAGSNPWMVMVKADKSKILEFSFPNNFISYRAFNYPELPWQLNRPAVSCEKIGTNIYLVAEPGHAEYRWSTGAATPSIHITEPGEYWVFVPYGSGFLSSERIRITDISHPCLFTGQVPLDLPQQTGIQVIPNPASGEATIRLDLPVSAHVVVRLISEMGIVVDCPVRGTFPAGTRYVPVNLSGMASGTYVVQMVTERAMVTRKLIVY
jgi:hypothetical protein